MSSVRALAWSMQQKMPVLRAWEPEDLAQEALLKAMVALEASERKGDFRGEAAKSTWLLSVARNVMVTMARAAALRPKPAGDAVLNVYCSSGSEDPGRILDLRAAIRDLVRWLRENPDVVEQGYQVVNLLLRSGANYSYVAYAMTVHTGQPWTAEGVRSVARRVKETEGAVGVRAALGITN